jgi:hypothetical protein
MFQHRAVYARNGWEYYIQAHVNICFQEHGASAEIMKNPLRLIFILMKAAARYLSRLFYLIEGWAEAEEEGA